MFDAGIKYFSESFSKTTFPVFSETIFIPTRPRMTSGVNNRWRTLASTLSSVCTAKGVGAIEGLAIGDAVGETVGDAAAGEFALWPSTADAPNAAVVINITANPKALWRNNLLANRIGQSLQENDGPLKVTVLRRKMAV